MVKFFIAFLFVVLQFTSAEAWPRRGSGTPLQPGKFILNIGDGDFNGQLTTNIINSTTLTFNKFTSAGVVQYPTSPGVLSDENFPIRNFPGVIELLLGSNAVELSTQGRWRIGWTAERSCFKLNVTAGSNVNVNSNPSSITIANGAGSGPFSMTGLCNQQAGYILITFVNANATVSAVWDPTYTQWSSNSQGGDFYMTREDNVGWNGQNDTTAYLSGGIFWTKEAVDFISALRPQALRFMGWNAINGANITSNVTNFGTRKPVKGFGWYTKDFPASTRAGGATTIGAATNVNGALTVAASTGISLGAWVDGEQITAHVPPLATFLTVTAVGANGGNCQITSSGSTTGLIVGHTLVMNGVGGANNCNNGTYPILSIDGPNTVTLDQANAGPQTCAGVGNAGGQCGTTPSATPPGITGWSITAIGNNGGKCQLTTNASTAGMSPGQTIMVFGLYGVVGASECMPANLTTTILTVDSGTQITINQAKAGGSCASLAACGNSVVGYQTLTVTGKSGGPKIIGGYAWTPAATSGYETNYYTFNYDAVTDRISAVPSGIDNAVPLEAQVQLTNLVRANYWYNFPPKATDSFIVSTLNNIKSNLTSDLKIWLELGNECWNPGQGCYQQMVQRGVALGIATVEPNQYQSLRLTQIYRNVLPTTNWAGEITTRVKRTYCIMGVFFQNDVFGYNQLSGAALGAFGFNSYPNRPGDFIDSVCLSQYAEGGSAFSGQSPDSPIAPTDFDTANLNAVVTATNLGNTAAANAIIDGYVRGDVGNRDQAITCTGGSGSPTITAVGHQLTANLPIRFYTTSGTACANLDTKTLYRVQSTGLTTDTFNVAPIIQGAATATVNPGVAGTGTTRVLVLGPEMPTFPIFSPYTVLASASYSYTNLASKVRATFPDATLGSRALATSATITIDQYEGNIEATGPSNGQCAALSSPINSTDCATIRTAVETWRASSLARATTSLNARLFVGEEPGWPGYGTVPENGYPAWLVLQNGGAYALNANASYVVPSPRGYYYGFQDFSTSP